MKTYPLVVEPSGGQPTETIELFSFDASVALGWGERSAQGRRFEIFEGGRSLGRAALSQCAAFWILSPASQQSGASPVMAISEGPVAG